MPSDERTARALEALRAPRESFRSAVAEAVEQVRGYLESQRPDVARAERAASELGSFASGRIDAARFAGLFRPTGMLSPEQRAEVKDALVVLRSTLEVGDHLFRVEVERGGDLRDAVRLRLAHAGRVFGAAQRVEQIRAGAVPAAMGGERHAGLHTFPFRRWNRAERQIAPPLVVEVDGEDVRAEELAELLDGAQKVVLVVRAACPPAPLVRLITPRVLVAQISDPAELDALCRTPGPAVVALVPEGAARFVHDPVGGATLASRLKIRWTPEVDACEPLGPRSAFQQREELAQLLALAEPAPAAAPVAGQGEAVDRLADWLLGQADLSDAG